MIHILPLSNLHNNVASIQKNRDDKSHRIIVASIFGRHAKIVVPSLAHFLLLTSCQLPTRSATCSTLEQLPVYFYLRTFIGVETAALTFRTKQYSTSYSSHICYGKRFYNDFFLNHHTIAFVNNFLKLLNCVVIETVLDLVKKKRINYLNSLLSARKRIILTSSRTVLNAMIAMHVHRQL